MHLQNDSVNWEGTIPRATVCPKLCQVSVFFHLECSEYNIFYSTKVAAYQ